MDDEERRQRYLHVLDALTELVCADGAHVVVDGTDAARLADRLAEALRSVGQPCARLSDESPMADEDAWRAGRTRSTVVIADGPRWRAQPPAGRWDTVIWLRRGPGGEEAGADVVIDIGDPTWPVIRTPLSDRLYLSETRAFFAVRAATWDAKFGADLPAYARAVAESGIPYGATVVDVGCGTGRALPALREAVGPAGTVVGLDLTPQMLTRARQTEPGALLVLADARRLPLADAGTDAVFAAGLVQHLTDPRAGLAELARVCRPGGRLVLFHPSGRRALAARHGRNLRAPTDGPGAAGGRAGRQDGAQRGGEPLDEANLRLLLDASGWTLRRYDDPPHRFFALALRSAG